MPRTRNTEFIDGNLGIRILCCPGRRFAAVAADELARDAGNHPHSTASLSSFPSVQALGAGLALSGIQ